MAQSLSKLYVHIIFHVKAKEIGIRTADKQSLYAYIGAIIKDHQSIPICINGMSDHIHILCVASRNIALSKLIEEIKRHSSRWIKTKDNYYRRFAWQKGYGLFSVSASVHDKTVQYIQNQEEHHKRITFKDEYIRFFKEYGIDYNEAFLWTD